MTRNLFACLGLLLFSLVLHAQPSYPNPVNTGASLPATCTPGGLVPAWFLLTAGGPIATPYYCSAPNTWTAASGGGGGAATCGMVSGEVCFDNSGAFGGMAGSSWDNTARDLNFVFNNGGTDPMIVVSENPVGDQNFGYVFSVNPNVDAAASVATTPGSVGGSIELFAVIGGDTTIATTGLGGQGGDIVFEGGFGGSATAAATASTGGLGGFVTLTAGTGGSANNAANTGVNHGGNGGLTNIVCGSGGNAANGTMNFGGNAGGCRLAIGVGGTGSDGNGTNGFFNVTQADNATSIFQISYAGQITTTLTGSMLPLCETNGVIYAGTNMAGVLACP